MPNRRLKTVENSRNKKTDYFSYYGQSAENKCKIDTDNTKLNITGVKHLNTVLSKTSIIHELDYYFIGTTSGLYKRADSVQIDLEPDALTSTPQNIEMVEVKQQILERFQKGRNTTMSRHHYRNEAATSTIAYHDSQEEAKLTHNRSTNSDSARVNKKSK